MNVIQQLNAILQGLLTNPIVAEYNQDGWEVIKYGNGRCVATKTTTVTPTTEGSAVGSIYTGNATTPAPAGVFKEVNAVWAATTTGDGIWVEPYRITEDAVNNVWISVLRGAKFVSAQSIPVELRIEGRWK